MVETQAVECPLCGAFSWEPCKAPGAKPLRGYWHAARIRVAASYAQPQHV